MSSERAWLLVGLLTVTTAAIRMSGPLITGGRTLGPRATRVVGLLPAAMLSALVVTSLLVSGGELHVDAAVIGVGAAGVLLHRGASVVTGVVVAAAVTALLRLAGLG